MGRDNIVLTTASRALETLAEYIPAVSARLVLHSWLHGDFQPANIIFGPDKGLYGIDITYSTRGVALADVAHILNHIRRLAFLPSGLHLLTSYQHILNAFLAGYCGEYSVVDSLVLSWYRLLDDLRFIIRYYPHIRSVHRWYIERLQSAAILQHVAMLHSSVSRNHPGRKIIGKSRATVRRSIENSRQCDTMRSSTLRDQAPTCFGKWSAGLFERWPLMR